ncbi:MAG: hypothetical protein AB2689_06055 [Candidatus Thiodiazotropha taylori]
MNIYNCIGCGCDNKHPCIDEITNHPCTWIRIDRKERIGVCSACAEHVERWDRGERMKKDHVEISNSKVTQENKYENVLNILAGILLSVFMVGLGLWTMYGNNQGNYTCGRGGCYSNISISLSMITIGIIFLGVAFDKIFPGAWVKVSKNVKRISTKKTTNRIPKYIYGEFPKRDEEAIDRSLQETKHRKKE